MQAHTELGDLPQFARDIAFLTGSGPASNRDVAPADHCVLGPFTGVLDVRLEPGRVPMPDLSYLSLEGLIVSTFSRAAGRRHEPTGLEAPPSADEHDDPGHGDDQSAERRELTVREVIHRDRRGPPPDDTVAGPRPGRVDRESGAHAHEADQRGDRYSVTYSDAGNVEGLEQPRIVPDPTDYRSRSAANDERPASSEPFPDRDVDRPGARRWSVDTDRSEQFPRRTRDRGPDRTVVDRSQPLAVGARRTPEVGTRRSWGDTDRATEAGDVRSPRLVTRGTPGDRHLGDEDTGGQWALAADGDPVPGSQWADQATGSGRHPRPTSHGEAGGEGRTRFEDPARGPRLVLERRGRASAAEADIDGPHEASSDRDTGPRGPGPSVDRTDDIGAVIDASTDPESRLVDRLYRTLQERDAIERRRRGGR